jgi:hypothetical protein
MAYRKIIKSAFEHRFYEAMGFPPIDTEGGIPLVIRITLGDMDLLDAFYIALPAHAASLSVEAAIRKHVLCENEEDRNKVRQKLSRDPNPDLLDIYDALLYLYQQAEAGEITISYHINNGASDIRETDPVSLHQQHCSNGGKFNRFYSLLDLVLEVYDNLDPFSGLTDEQKDAMLGDFRRIFALYLMDRFSYQSPNAPTPQCPISPTLSSALECMASEDLLIRVHGEYTISPRGYDLLNGIINEAEFYIDNYDIFGDVYVNGAGEIRFNTGYGSNLIVPVFSRVGIDPYRALFVAALYLGNMDYLASGLDMLFSEAPFSDLFSLIVHSPKEKDVGTELLDRIIQEGSLKVQEQQLREARLKRVERIQRHISEVDSQQSIVNIEQSRSATDH